MDVRIIDIINKHKFGESRKIRCVCEQQFCAFVVLVTISSMQRLFLCVGSYSPDIYTFQFCSALNPDGSICMNRHYSPWFFTKFGLRFAEYTIFDNEY